MNKIVLTIITILGLTMPAFSESRLVNYPAPQGAEQKNDFTVKVRQAGKDWQYLPTYTVKVDKVTGVKHNVEKASLSYFDFEGEVEVSVTPTSGNIKEWAIRPLSYAIKADNNGKTLTFKLDRPRNLSVEINGDRYHNLQLFANPIDKNAPKKKKLKNFIYYGPGLHTLDKQGVKVPSGTTVYVAGGAVVNGFLDVKNVHDVKILGRGIIRPEGRGAGVLITSSKRVYVDGIITTQCPVGESDSVEINNVKVISSYNWGDGLNVFASSNVKYDGCFARTSDDCTTVYATRLGHTGSCKNILMQNSTLWADVAHPIFIGLHGNSKNPDTIEDVTYRNIDILGQAENQIDYQGCMAINSGDNNLVRNVTFENIRIEEIQKGMLVNMRVCYNKKYCTAPGRNIENVTFKNISYKGREPNLSVITGYDDTRTIKNVTFKNLNINGTIITDDMPTKPKWYKTGDMAHMFIGEHVEGLTFTE